MNDDILDEEFIEKKSFIKENWRYFLVPLIMWIFVVEDYISFPYFQNRLLIGYLGLIIVSVLLFVSRDYGLLALFILLLLGIFGVLNQYTWTTILHLGISFHLFYLALFILQFSILPNGFVSNRTGSVASHNEENKISKEERLANNRFMRVYKSKTDKELKTIIESPQYSKEAVEAAKELLESRNT